MYGSIYMTFEKGKTIALVKKNQWFPGVRGGEGGVVEKSKHRELF